MKYDSEQKPQRSLLISQIASVQDVAKIKGTPRYMAPEQWEGKADERTDVLQLSSMLYELITGIKPEARFESLKEIKPKAAIFDEIIDKGLSRNPAKRYASVKELSDAVKGQMPGDTFLQDDNSPSQREKITSLEVAAESASIVGKIAKGVGTVMRYGLGTVFHIPTVARKAYSDPSINKNDLSSRVVGAVLAALIGGGISAGLSFGGIASKLGVTRQAVYTAIATNVLSAGYELARYAKNKLKKGSLELIK